ncbi:MAG: MFS transporter [Pseudonocardia sp.]|nr:MFS transporter [Pseudonocardia sp.]
MANVGSDVAATEGLSAGQARPSGVAPRRGGMPRELWAASALSGLASVLAGTAGALLARQVAGSEAVAGLPQAMLVAGAAVTAVGLSLITRRYGRRIALSVGAATAVVGCSAVVVAVLVDSLPGVLAGFALLGSGSAAVMLGRYAAADLAPEASRARAMGSVLVATTAGAVVGANLLAPSTALADRWGMPGLFGPYLVAALGFAVATGALLRGGTWPPVPVVASVAPASGAIAGPGRQGYVGLAVLGVSNLVMVAVMTMAPIHLHHLGAGLGTVGLIVSMHIAGMFAPSLLSGRLSDRYGPLPVAAGAAVTMAASSLLVVAGSGSPPILALALLLGAGWNLGLVAGSVLLTSQAPLGERPRREARVRSPWAPPPRRAAQAPALSWRSTGTRLSPWPAPTWPVSACWL